MEQTSIVPLLQHCITPQQAGTLPGLFRERVRLSPDKVAYCHFMGETWREFTWREMAEEVEHWRRALAAQGLQRGDRVAVMLRNGPNWVLFDQAALALGLVVVPLFTIDRPDNIAHIVRDAAAKLLFFDNAEHWRGLRSVLDQLDGLQCLVSVEALEASGEPRLRSLRQFLQSGQKPAAAAEIAPDDLATLIYTSGTTGRPKGVMLTHANILSNAHATLDTFPVCGDDMFLSFLPLSHAFERTLGYYLPMMSGATVAFTRSVALLSEDLKYIRPTLLISVPRIYERIHGAIRARLEENAAYARALFQLAVEVGWARFEHAQGRGSWKPIFLLWPLLDRLVARKFRDRLGGRLRSAISGGAALAPEISRMFIALGLPVVQGYGLTEASPVVSGNRPGSNLPSSVGQPLRGVQVCLGPQDELWVRGPSVMRGYWRQPEATRELIDAEGWLRTGDIARLESGGHITITGRLKEIIVMSNGEKIPPSDMEIALLQDALFEQVMVFGEARPHLVVLAVVNDGVWSQFAEEAGIRADMPEALSDSRIEAKVLKRIAQRLRGFPGYARVHRVLLLREPWTIENGLLTPTLKLRRNEVTRQFSAEIAGLYAKR
jgi:long-chain acyl-CoA synthetase